jgi:hypothetical protein
VLQSWCVTASTTAAGLDCKGRTVLRFTSTLVPAFAATANVKYWLQISEDDSDSVQGGGTVDFRWSGYRPQRLCQAQQIDNLGVHTCNISDDCIPPVATDLSYVLKSACVGGVVVMPAGVIVRDSRFGLEFRQTGIDPPPPPIYSSTVHVDEDGSYITDDIPPDGMYDVTLVGMGIRPTIGQTTIQNGVGTPLNFNVLAMGDLNNDRQLDGMDIGFLVAGLFVP